MKKATALILLVVMAAFAAMGCKGGNGSEVPSPQSGNVTAPEGTKPNGTDTGKGNEATPQVTKEAEPEPDKNPVQDTASDPYEGLTPYSAHEKYTSAANDITEVGLSFDAEGGYAFDSESTLYSKDLTLTVTVPDGAEVYYSLNGRDPDRESLKYTEPLQFAAHGGDFPSAYTFRAAAFFPDGTVSKTAARTFLVSSKLNGRFTTLIFSVTGDPDDLTEGPDGIFYGENYKSRGRESERPVYVEAWRADGTSLISQFAGVRIYGGYSRQSSIKSMKLFSRSSYDPDNKNFGFSEFGTEKLDGSDKIIKKYDKLVLRNFGNDFQFAFIRDELSQALCKTAGFECYEACLPAVVYLNGEYYGYFWLHESYCDKYLKEKFGDAEGEFYILEGSEKHKNDDEDCQELVDEFNRKYDEFSAADLKDDAEYAKLCEFMDVEDYLDYYAWNIALNNWDWPNNNYKCYRYVEADASVLAAEGAKKTPDSEVFDGRYRFLVHDMDYAYGIYDQSKAQAAYNNLNVILNRNNERYSPLFKKLMERKDCRSYFRNKTIEFVNGALSERVITDTYRTLCTERDAEQAYFYKFLTQLRRRGDQSIWTSAGYYAGVEQQILAFAKDRAGYVLKYLDAALPEIE